MAGEGDVPALSCSPAARRAAVSRRAHAGWRRPAAGLGLVQQRMLHGLRSRLQDA